MKTIGTRTEAFPSAYDRITREPTQWSIWFIRGANCTDEDWAIVEQVHRELADDDR